MGKMKLTEVPDLRQAAQAVREEKIRLFSPGNGPQSMISSYFPYPFIPYILQITHG